MRADTGEFVQLVERAEQPRTATTSRLEVHLASGRRNVVDPATDPARLGPLIATTSDARDLTPHGWKAKWLSVVTAHRASIVEKPALKRST